MFSNITSSPLELEAKSAYLGLAGKVAPYNKLNKECYRFNRTIKTLYPKDFWQLRLEAHHVIEKRFFHIYRDFFKKEMGYNSENDMPAVAIHSTWHRNTPKKRLKQMVGIDLTGLSQHLINAFKRRKDDSPGVMLEIYKEAYDIIHYEGHIVQALPRVWEAVEPILLKLVQYAKSGRLG